MPPRGRSVSLDGRKEETPTQERLLGSGTAAPGPVGQRGPCLPARATEGGSSRGAACKGPQAPGCSQLGKESGAWRRSDVRGLRGQRAGGGGEGAGADSAGPGATPGAPRVLRSSLEASGWDLVAASVVWSGRSVCPGRSVRGARRSRGERGGPPSWEGDGSRGRGRVQRYPGADAAGIGFGMRGRGGDRRDAQDPARTRWMASPAGEGGHPERPRLGVTVGRSCGHTGLKPEESLGCVW